MTQKFTAGRYNEEQGLIIDKIKRRVHFSVIHCEVIIDFKGQTNARTCLSERTKSVQQKREKSNKKQKKTKKIKAMMS